MGSEPTPARSDGEIASQPGVEGMRAAMYGEMAATAAGNRPERTSGNEWDAALAGAKQFILASATDEQTKQALLNEAATTCIAGEVGERDRSSAAICDRLAAEFRWQLRHR